MRQRRPEELALKEVGRQDLAQAGWGLGRYLYLAKQGNRRRKRACILQGVMGGQGGRGVGREVEHRSTPQQTLRIPLSPIPGLSTFAHALLPRFTHRKFVLFAPHVHTTTCAIGLTNPIRVSHLKCLHCAPTRPAPHKCCFAGASCMHSCSAAATSRMALKMVHA